MKHRNPLRYLLGPRGRRLLLVDAVLYGTAAVLVLWPTLQQLIRG